MWFEKRQVSLTFAVLIAVEIFLFSSIPGSATGGKIPFASIAYHLIVFFLLTFFLFFLIKGKKKISQFNILSAIIISQLYAITDEIHQAFVPLRSSGLFDVFVDFAGIYFSVLLIFFFLSKSNPQL